MNSFERFQSLLILVAVGLGLVLGQLTLVEKVAENFVLPFLLLMLYGLFLAIPVKNLHAAFKNLKFLSTSTVINFIWTPILAWGLGALFLAGYPALWLGFILLLVTPCTDWYLIFTSIAKGNMSLSTSILPINLILQIILLPVYLFIFAGTSGTVDFSTVFEGIIFVLLVPFILANVTKYILKNKKKFLEQTLIPFFSSAQLLFLCLAIIAMFASEGRYLLNHAGVILLILIPLCLFFIVNFFIAWIIGRLFKFSYENWVSLNMTIIARNSPLALAVVVTILPDEPLVALVLIIGPLIELPVLAVLSQILLRIRKKNQSSSSHT